MVSGDDTASAPIALSELFNYYGTNFGSMVMASNGYLTTDLADTGPDLSNDCPLPAVPSTPGGTNGMRIYPLHDDLILNGGSSQGYVQYFAACPRVEGVAQGCTVFQWNDVEHFGGGGPWDQQVILYHASGTMVAQIGPGNPETGSGSTTGIQSDPTSGVNLTGLTYACNVGGSIPDNTAVCFGLPQGPDLELTKTASNPNPGVSEPVDFTITVTNLDGAASQAGVTVTDNLPAGMTYLGDSCGGDFADGVWAIGTLGPGAQAVCVLSASYDSCGVVTNSATVSADTLDPPGNNTDSVTLNAGADAVTDGGFEACDPPSAPDACPNWGETSTNFGTPVCDSATCGTGGGTAGPRTGDNWAWFGGATAFEEGTVDQSVTIPTGDFATLTFYLWNGASGNPGVDFLEATMDGTQVFLALDGDATYTGGYALVSVDVSAYADGAAHTLEIHSIQNTGTPTNFSVDDVSLVTCTQFVPVQPPSVIEIPTLDGVALAGLALFLAGAAFVLLRRRTA